MHPIAFNLGSISVHWYGVLVAMGFLAGLWTASRRALLQGVPQEKILDIGPWLIIGSIVGARTLYVIEFWGPEFSKQPIWEIFMVQHGGLVYYGGLIGASLSFILFARLKKVPLWKFADILAPSIALGYVFGRLGCLMNGCCYGRACSLPWAVHYPSSHLTYPQGVHPTQIYESLLNLALYGGLAWLYRRKRFDGQVFGAYLVGYAILRSFVETFRGDYPQYQRFLDGIFTPAQLASLVILVTGLSLLWWLRRWKPQQQ